MCSCGRGHKQHIALDYKINTDFFFLEPLRRNISDNSCQAIVRQLNLTALGYYALNYREDLV